ncbi:hypothetical protein LINPERHAP2_LOCUS6604 [Linum perenne]
MEKSRVRRKFADAIIINTLGKVFPYTFMSRKIPQLWGKKGVVRISDVGWGFFVVKFDSVEDYERAMFGGPWMVGDHYVVIQTWRPYFRPEDSTLSTLRLWVRLPGLPLEYFDYSILQRIGDRIGKTVRIDHTTLEGTRGNFARICVEVDLSKPLLSKYRLRRRVRRVEYEGLHTICFGCGCYGHEESACPETIDAEKSLPGSTSFSNPVFNEVDRGEERPEVEEDFGPWMKVKRQSRRPGGSKQSSSLSPRVSADPKPGENTSPGVPPPADAPMTDNQVSSAARMGSAAGKGKGKSHNSFKILEDLGDCIDSGIPEKEIFDSPQRTETIDGDKENLEAQVLEPNQGPRPVSSNLKAKTGVMSSVLSNGAKVNKFKATAGSGGPKGESQKGTTRVGLSVIKPKESFKPGLRKSNLASGHLGADFAKPSEQTASKSRSSGVTTGSGQSLESSKRLGAPSSNVERLS